MGGPARSVKKGQLINIPIRAMNTYRPLWGDDAEEFRYVAVSLLPISSLTRRIRPERWTALPEAVQAIPGVWGNMLTFLAGPRSCIGYRFALIECVSRLSYSSIYLLFVSNDELVVG